MATEAEARVGETNSINFAQYVGTTKVDVLEGLNATKANEEMIHDVKNEETERVKSSELRKPENTKLESDSAATVVPNIEADVKEDKDQVNKGNAVELTNGSVDSTLAIEQELKSEATKESIFPEAAVEEVKCNEEPSPVEVSEGTPEFVSNEAATSDATAQEVIQVKTTNTNNIEESTTLESFQDVPESAAEEEPCLLDVAVTEKENTDTLLADSSEAEEIPENVPEPSLTETGEDTQVTDSTAMEEVQKNIPESSVSTTEKKETLIAESSKTLVITGNILETAVLETPVEVSKVPMESSFLVVMDADTTNEAFEVNKDNAVELSNGFADCTLAIEQETKSEATKESIFPVAAVEEVKCTEEPSPIEVPEDIPEFVYNEAATCDATAQEVITTNTNNIEESTLLESFQGVPESAAEELCLLDAAVTEKDTLLANSSQAEEITENVTEPSLTETGEDTQVTDSTAMEEVQKNHPETFVSTTEKKENLIAESSKTLVVTENVLETAVLETPVEVPKVPKESSVSVVMDADTTVEAFEVISKVSGDAKKVEEKKGNSLGKLFMQENEGVAEDQKMTTDENTSLVQSSGNNVDDVGNEKLGKEAEKKADSSELSTAEVKSSNQKSNNIFTKMKQSIVKAKKVIIGKSPSSKAMEVESRDDIKL